MNDTAAHIIVSGDVQGVGYRFFTSRKAVEFGLTGYVKNLPDGRVEIVACGDRERIDGLVSALRIGPRASNVRDVLIEWVMTTEAFERFEIR